MNIFQNAVNSIQIGIEDYQSDDERRSVSAVRNIAAGILLLYKEKLCQLSPKNNKELLIKQHLRPVQSSDGEITFEGKGHKTVDVQSIKDRFKSLKITVEWKRFDEINKLRNELEHYYTTQSPNAVREIVAKSFLLIRDFLSEYLEKDPQEVLGEEAWTILLDVSEVYAAEEEACKKSIAAIDWRYSSIEDALDFLRCEKCHSSLIQAPHSEDRYPNISLHCKSCNYDFSFENIIEQCIDDLLSGDAGAHVTIKDGGELPYDKCLECEQDTFIHCESCCVACGYEVEYTNCIYCEESLSIEELWDGGGTCGHCEYKFEKSMAE